MIKPAISETCRRSAWKMSISIISRVFPVSIFILSFFGCQSYKTNSVPVVEKGVIDIRDYDFKKQGILSLSGDWEFYWNKLIPPSELSSAENRKPATFIRIPGYWNKQPIGESQLPPFGNATLKLTLIHNSADKELGIYIREIPTAYKLFVDGKLLFENGSVGTNEKSHKAVIIPRYDHFVPKSLTSTIVIHISNYSDRIGGMSPVRLGLRSQIESDEAGSVARDFFLLGSFILIGLYHIALFFMNRKEKSALFFGIFCLSLGLRTIIMGERYLHMVLSFLGYDNLIRIEFLTIPLAAVFLMFYFGYLFGYRIYEFANKVFFVLSMVMSLGIIVLPLAVYGEIFSIYQLVIILMGAFIVSGLIIAIRKKKEGARIFLVGFIFLFATILNDAFVYIYRDFPIGYLLPFGMLVFIFAQSVILLKKLVNAIVSIEKLSERLMSLDKLKDAFLANTSHELRTPLYGIIGLAEGMKDGKMGRLTENQSRSLSLIVSSGRRLANLVNDILDFSKMKKKQLVLHKQPVDLREITDVVFVFSHPLLSNKNVTLDNRIPPDFPFVDGDEMRLQQIMHNLIGNAIKFTEYGEIVVSADKKGNIAYVSVNDTGIGIPREKFEVIFESFEQVDPSISRTYGGTGIGLSIVKQLITLHGGKIVVESEVGKGSKFTFSLPLSPQQVKREEVTEDLSQARLIEVPDTDYSFKTADSDDVIYVGNKRLKVLVVDDEPIHHEVIDSQLDSVQFDLTHAMNGNEALAAVGETRFDAILLDIMMPGMSGYIVCKKIREKYAKHEVPIIILTAKNLVTDLVEGLEAGANDYISKPINRSELLARIKTHVQLAKVNLAYSRFVPRSFLKLLGRDSIIDVERGDQVQLDMTICFCDIRSFMTLSETMTPRENFNFLNSYFEKMAPVIRKNKGYIDKYIGDGIMALFPSHPEDALKAALEMKRVVSIYNSFRGKVGYNPISVGIGIHTGPIMLGTIGDETRMEGTVISDTVNIAARLEGLTKLYGGSIIISSAIFLSLNDPSLYNYRFLGLAQVKGKRDSVPVYEVFDPEESGQRKLQTKDFFEKALQAFFRKEFSNAEKAFLSVLEIDPYDKAARLYYNRSKELKDKDVPEDWDGHETMDFK